MEKMKIGLDGNARKAVADAINGVLADTYVVYQKTHAYHWNVTGPLFHQLHVMFEEQYREMWAALDELAERTRALGEFAPSSAEAFSALASIKSDDKTSPAADQMIRNLLADHEALIRRTRSAFDIAEEVDDAASADLLTQRIQTHEKTAWMLRAMTQ